MQFDTPKADRITAVVLLALGAAMTWGGFVMDRLEIRQIHPSSIPGLLPIILGAVLMVCAVLLALTADKTEREAAEAAAAGSWPNFAFTALWSCVFALALVGRLPFAAASALYIFGFTAWFGLRASRGEAGLGKRAALLAVFAVVVASAVALLFRYGFLVRLP